MTGFNAHQALVAQLGKVKTGKACLHINKLAEVVMKILKALIKADVGVMAQKYPG